MNDKVVLGLLVVAGFIGTTTVTVPALAHTLESTSL
jgi:hypothetical protein